jgi:hypothetical protein
MEWERIDDKGRRNVKGGRETVEKGRDGGEEKKK